MGRTADLDRKLAWLETNITDSGGVAEILGLSQRNDVSTYKRRYDDFPEPVLNLGAGRCLLWLRSDIEAWRRDHPGRPG